jgi:hypothetical protein
VTAPPTPPEPKTGPWKEGRLCAASLFYPAPRADQIAWVADNHSAVGIRASVTRCPESLADTLAKRNWDLRDTLTPSPNGPRHRTESDAGTVQAAIAAAKPTGEWIIWEFPAETLDKLGPAGHRALLQWLGDEHAKVWCAPIKDIAAWNASHPPAARRPE